MDLVINFISQGVQYSAGAYFALNDSPGYIFLDLLDLDLVNRFGKEISIKTDGDQVLPHNDDYPALVELRNAIFTSIKSTRAFQFAKTGLGQKDRTRRLS